MNTPTLKILLALPTKQLPTVTASSGPLESLPGERIKLQELLSQYESDDIYNADETGLFYRMLSYHTKHWQDRLLRAKNK